MISRTTRPTRERYDLVIVGGSVAGNSAAQAFAATAPERSVLLLEKSTELPHDKPPLSKGALVPGWINDSAYFLDEKAWAASPIELCLGAAATGVKPGRVTVGDREIHAGSIILAPGGTPVRLSDFDDASNVFTLRSLRDAAALRAAAATALDAVVVGAGFIGLEIASSLSEAGLRVKVIARGSRPLERIIGAEASDRLVARHRERGVRFHTSATITSVHRDTANRVNSIWLDDGSELASELVVVGVGMRASTEWLAASPLDVSDGIVCDECLQSKLPGVFAAGDAASFIDTSSGDRVRIEHWSTAGAQGRFAAANALAWLEGSGLRVYSDVPYVWSDQAGVRVQIVGRPSVHDERIVEVDADDRYFVRTISNGEVTGGVAIGANKEAMLLRRQLLERAQRQDTVIPRA